ncbi:expression site-associated gene 9 (ESAG9) protein, putative [Trypanosoma brucei brucei TREU927]|uniref:Expression site-associated gene 9 (ESAG9) protein, putative n=1 Tax=Trypanosoma brucei brucei (strain 927/4 GUTat10.1) TaxID=185431 RepID=Q4GY59_TRYB2|nr:expression site-associated gene 9 (ESAG9) protein, putative [Trypanosoma brucei brucei TREU927]CAJ16728.1 expression site-associated gene 9 (ESAG9) protein, putative [Trypanosoma brucei brucei TREU927]
MVGLATVPLLTLTLLALCGESEASVVVSSGSQECEGYWDSSRRYHCTLHNTGGEGQRRVRLPPTPAAPARDKKTSGGTGVDTQGQEARKDTVLSSTSDGRTSQPPPANKETFPAVNGKSSDSVGGGVSKDEVVQRSESFKVSAPATSPARDYSKPKVDRARQELGDGEGYGRESVKGNAIVGKQVAGPDGGNVVRPPPQDVVSWPEQKNTQEAETMGIQSIQNGKDISDRITQHDNSHVMRPPTRGVVSVAEENAQEIIREDIDGEAAGENSSRKEKGAAHKGHVMLLSAVLGLTCS